MTAGARVVLEAKFLRHPEPKIPVTLERDPDLFHDRIVLTLDAESADRLRAWLRALEGPV